MDTETMKTETIVNYANSYGNIMELDIPTGYTHVKGKRLTITCRAHDIPCLPVVVGFTGGKWNKAILWGVAVADADVERLRSAMDIRRKRRLTPEQKAARKKARQAAEKDAFYRAILDRYPHMRTRDAEECAEHATEIGSGRVGRSSSCEDPVRAAVVAYVRHNYTQYEEYITQYDREEARDMVAAEISKKLESWS